MTFTNGTFTNHVTQTGPLAVNASFQLIDVRDLDMIDSFLISVRQVTDFQ